MTIVENIVRSSDSAVQGLQENILNLTAYAKKIQQDVAEQTKKEVRQGSIVVALSRIQKKLQQEKNFTPRIEASNITISVGLVELVYVKDTYTLQKLSQLYRRSSGAKAPHLTINHGLHEVSIITREEDCQNVLRLLRPKKPLVKIHDLACVTLQVDPAYTYTKNTFYALLKIMAPRNINIIELLTTSTEISFFVEEKDWEKTFATLSDLVQRKI